MVGGLPALTTELLAKDTGNLMEESLSFAGKNWLINKGIRSSLLLPDK